MREISGRASYAGGQSRRKSHAWAATRSESAFTLLELLTVLAIIGILAAIVMPAIDGFRPNPGSAVARQLMDDISRARQLAISQRTTVYMVFVPRNFWTDTAFQALPPAEQQKADSLYEKQLIGYNFVTLRSLGDQPGRPTARYLSNWRTLPQGAFIAVDKFTPRNPANPQPVLNILTNNVLAFRVFGFNITNNIPFPAHDTPGTGTPPKWAWVPYLAFNHLGQLESGQSDLIPISKGSVHFRRDPALGGGTRVAPTVLETPPGNTTNSGYNVVSIDWLTGRAHLHRQEVQ